MELIAEQYEAMAVNSPTTNRASLQCQVVSVFIPYNR